MSIDHDIGPSAEVVERRRRSADRWKRRSRGIKSARRILPAIIVLVFVGLALWLVGRGVVARLTAPKQSGDSVVKMTNPRFYGRDASGHAFVVSAQLAERRLSSAQAVVLTNPAMSLESDDSNATRVQASRGVYQEKLRQVQLEGGVRVTHGPGFNLTTPRAVIDTQTGVVRGDQGVQGRAPLGQITASSYGVYDRGRRVVFSGGVHAHIEPSGGKP